MHHLFLGSALDDTSLLFFEFSWVVIPSLRLANEVSLSIDIDSTPSPAVLARNCAGMDQQNRVARAFFFFDVFLFAASDFFSRDSVFPSEGLFVR